MDRVIDLNADLGESFGPWVMGDDPAMLEIVTSANVACGGHASDPETMYKTLVLARERGVIVGAHPGYNDREGFGRRVIPMTPDAIVRMVVAQVGALQALARMADVEVAYLKAHGALSNYAAVTPDAAAAVAEAARVTGLPLLAVSGTELEAAGRAAGVPVFSEIFADRGYLSTGQLVPRGQDGAMLHDPEEAAERLLRVLETGRMPVIDGDPIALKAESICVHGDGPAAVAMAREVRARLTAAGVTLRGFVGA